MTGQPECLSKQLFCYQKHCHVGAVTSADCHPIQTLVLKNLLVMIRYHCYKSLSYKHHAHSLYWLAEACKESSTKGAYSGSINSDHLNFNRGFRDQGVGTGVGYSTV